jgi:hypothetical protein
MSEDDGTPQVLASDSTTETATEASAPTTMTMDELTSAVSKMRKQMDIIINTMEQSIKDELNAVSGGRRRRSRRGKRPRKSRRSRRH